MAILQTSDDRPVGVQRVLRAGAGFGVVAVAGGLLWPVAAAVLAADVWRAHRGRIRTATAAT
ncbi:hypothetical protein [Cryptosporangium minutisporangium]|uniref:hypothetical protein n=1 Tax=Cryptosporangium minutisporangium TaxID=113569 RepID=UPI0031E7BFF4